MDSWKKLNEYAFADIRANQNGRRALDYPILYFFSGKSGLRWVGDGSQCSIQIPYDTEVAKTKKSFGALLGYGQPFSATHAFDMNDDGLPDVLEINGLSTSCGCTKAAVESETIMPGKTTNLLVTFDPNIMGDDEVGDILRVIYIKSNDPNQPEVEVEIKANVKK